MSVLIKGMEMPKSCYLCPFCDYVSARCDAVKGTPYTPPTRYEVRADWCPLIPVPDHGRLIDKDALEQDISDSVVFSGRENNPEIYGANKIINRIHLAQTIIPASKEDT